MDRMTGAAQRHGHKAYVIAAVALVTVAAIGWSVKLWGHRQQGSRQPASTHQNPADKSDPERVSMRSRMLFVGDIYWGRYLNKKAQASQLKEAYPFARLHEFDRVGYDAWIGNLECPSVPGVVQPYGLESRQLLFNCPVSYLPEFAKWFTGVSLANNHTSNQRGQAGLDATRSALDAVGVQYFGHYDPDVTEDICDVLTMPARLVRPNGETKQVKLPLAFCGYHGLSKVPSAASVAVMEQYAAYMPVVAYVHMGTEYTAAADDTRRSLYRSMIDHGADVVVGGHPHWTQPAEAYKGKLILYSLGNFMFDQKQGETSRGAAVAMQLEVIGISSGEAKAWTDLGHDCAVFRDDCLLQAKTRQLSRLPATFTYEAFGVDMAGYQTHPADGAMTQTVLDRLEWQRVVTELQQ